MADLNVWQTLKFALTNKTKKNEKHEVSLPRKKPKPNYY